MARGAERGARSEEAEAVEGEPLIPARGSGIVIAMDSQALELGIARMKITLAKVVQESEFPAEEGVGSQVVALRVVLVAAAQLLEEHGSAPVQELISVAVGANAGAEVPASPAAMSAFLLRLCDVYAEGLRRLNVAGGSR